MLGCLVCGSRGAGAKCLEVAHGGLERSGAKTSGTIVTGWVNGAMLSSGGEGGAGVLIEQKEGDIDTTCRFYEYEYEGYTLCRGLF